MRGGISILFSSIIVVLTVTAPAVNAFQHYQHHGHKVSAFSKSNIDRTSCQSNSVILSNNYYPRKLRDLSLTTVINSNESSLFRNSPKIRKYCDSLLHRKLKSGIKYMKSTLYEKKEKLADRVSIKSPFKKKHFLLVPSILLCFLLSNTKSAIAAMAVSSSSKSMAPMKRQEMVSAGSLFFVLFVGLALLHAAEISITTLYPWKVKEFAEEGELIILVYVLSLLPLHFLIIYSFSVFMMCRGETGTSIWKTGSGNFQIVERRYYSCSNYNTCYFHCM